MSAGASLLSVKSATVRFGGLTALNDVSFDISPGEIIGLIGPNGAGKTTLFSTLVGFIRPTSGEIAVAGVRVNGMRPHRVAALGMTKTFQNTALFPGMTLFENVMTAAVVREKLADARRTATECLTEVGLAEAANANVDELTFPQRALAEVARALASRPKILLLDEVMAALTPREMDAVIAGLLRIRDQRGLALIVVEHHMRAIMQLSERILVLNFGRLLADGSPDAVTKNPDVIAAYLGASHAQDT
jgi:branched-chain amino acid transport system ATP-binding protein